MTYSLAQPASRCKGRDAKAADAKSGILPPDLGKLRPEIQSIKRAIMSVTIFHNPNCSTSRKVLGWLKEKGIEPKVVEYLKTPPSATELKRILKLMGGAKAADILRRKGDAYEALGDVADMKGDELIAKMVAEPVLIERPIVVTDKAAVLCRPPEKVWDIV
jgi:arsenate reductase